MSQGGNQHHSRKGYGGYDEYNNYSNSRGGGGGYHAGGVNDSIRNAERGIAGLGLSSGDRSGGSNTTHGNRQEQQQKDAPRKTTWASIASQPAKPTVTQTSTILKKKGPGMPPPPMVPGRHNMDIGTWDSPSKNGPPLVPPTFTEPPTPPPARQNGGPDGPAWPTPGQAVNIEPVPSQQPQPPEQRPATARVPDRERQNSYNSYNDAPSSGGGGGGGNEHSSYRGGSSNHSQMQPPSHQYHSNYSAAPAHPPQSTYSAPPPPPPAPVEDTTEALNKLLDMSKYNPVNFDIDNVHLAR